MHFPGFLPALMGLLLSRCVSASIAVYWGQTTGSSLADFCSSSPADIFIVSFLSDFGISPTTLNLAGNCETTFSGSNILSCPDIGSQIKSCQAAGKKVFLSLGGGAGSYGFTSDSQAQDFAQTLWNLFGEGSSSTRPFGDAVVDGFDFDIETGNPTGYAALAAELRSTYFPQGSKSFYLSAAPQCPLPDASVNDLLTHADIDYAFIQFYNNPSCAVQGTFNFDKWQDATSGFGNPNIKLYLGLPGSSSSAGSGYVSDYSTLQSAISTAKSYSNFGGVMLWDAYSSSSNTINGESYVNAISGILGGSSGGSSNTVSSSVLTSSAIETSGAPVVTPGAPVVTGNASTTSSAVNTADPVVDNGKTVVFTQTESVSTTTVTIADIETVTLARLTTAGSVAPTYTKNWVSWGNSTVTAAAAAAAEQPGAVIVAGGVTKTITIATTKTVYAGGASQTVYEDTNGNTVNQEQVVEYVTVTVYGSGNAGNYAYQPPATDVAPAAVVTTTQIREIIVKSSDTPISTIYQEIGDPTTTLYQTKTVQFTTYLNATATYNGTLSSANSTAVATSNSTSNATYATITVENTVTVTTSPIVTSSPIVYEKRDEELHYAHRHKHRRHFGMF